MSNDANFRPVLPFIIDGPGYSDRDRQMFVAGVELCQVYHLLDSGLGIDRPVHKENEDRLRVLCSRQGRVCRLDPIDETWMQLIVEPQP